jgi:hypothetical protein
MFLDLAQT